MERLSGLDASFLYLETPTSPMHVGAVLLLRPTAGTPFGARLLARIVARLDRVPLFANRLMPMPFELDHPAWIPAVDLEPARHIRTITVEAPGDDAALAAAVARLHARPLDRARPLWAMWLIEGLAGGGVALYAKVHHCAADGAGALAALRALVDGPDDGLDDGLDGGPDEGEAPAAALRGDWAAIDERALVKSSLVRGVAWPFGAASALAGLAADAMARRREAASADSNAPARSFEAPATVFNKSIGAARTLAFARLDLARLRAVAEGAGATLNEVFLTVVAGALRRYLDARGALPEAPLVAAVPVAERGPPAGLFGLTGEAEAEANRIGVMLVGLASDEASDAARLPLVMAQNRAARTAYRALPATGLRRWALVGGPFIAARAARLHASLALADRHPPPFNLVVSLLMAPPGPLSLAGAVVEGAFPVSVVQDGAGLNVTAIAREGVLEVGLVACALAIPNPAVLAAQLEVALAALPLASPGPRRRRKSA